MAAQQRRDRQARTERENASEAVYLAARRRPHGASSRTAENEKRSRANYTKALEAGGMPVPVRPTTVYARPNAETAAALEELLDGSQTVGTLEDFLGGVK